MLRASQNYVHAAERGLSIFEFARSATLPDREQWEPGCAGSTVRGASRDHAGRCPKLQENSLALTVHRVAFTVSVRPSGHRFEVQAGEAILDAALRQGIRLPYGCRNGECGSCKGRVQSGEITYPEGEPPALHPREQALGYAIVCQAHAEERPLTRDPRDPFPTGSRSGPSRAGSRAANRSART